MLFKKNDTMNSLKHLTISMLVLLSISTNAQNDLPMSEERLNGKYSSFDSENNLTTSGEFKNNLRVGKWIVKDTSDRVILTREYHSVYAFTEKHLSALWRETKTTNANHRLEETIHIDFPLEKDSIGLYKFPPVADSNVVWSKRVRSILPREENKIIYAKDFLTKLRSLSSYNVYTDDELSEVLPREKIDFKNSKLVAISLKKDYFFEKTINMMQERIVAITFHLENKKTGLESSFSVYYALFGRLLLSTFAANSDNELIKNLDDLLFFQDYSEIIYQEEHFDLDEPLDLKNIEKYSKKSDDIKRLVLEVEHKYWVGGH